VARALIVGCGCRGRELGKALAAQGWEVRGTTRDPRRQAAITEAGLEAAVADPEQPGTILDLVGDVSVVVWLLAAAQAEPEVIAAIHGPRLERLLEKLVDTPVRAFVYEGRGPVQGEHLESGAEIVARAGETWRIPVRVLDHDPGADNWTAAAVAEVKRVIG
jgi:nucleoside-diphosphate-sugar epimerase